MTRRSTLIACTTSLVVLPGLVLAPAVHATGEYEPNETPAAATPLAPPGSSMSATIEAPVDVDRYVLYVHDPTTLYLTITNANPDDGSFMRFHFIHADLRDARDEQVASFSPVSESKSDTEVVDLPPGRYNWVISNGGSSGAPGPVAYTLTHTGGTVTVETMQATCDAATSELTRADAKVRRARKRLVRARHHGTRLEVRQGKRRLAKARRHRARVRSDVRTYCVAL